MHLVNKVAPKPSVWDCDSWFYVTWTHAGVVSQQGSSVERVPTRMACGEACGTFSGLMVDVVRPRLTVGGAIRGLATVGAVRKQVEPPFKSKPVSSLPRGLGIRSPLQVPALLALFLLLW